MAGLPLGAGRGRGRGRGLLILNQNKPLHFSHGELPELPLSVALELGSVGGNGPDEVVGACSPSAGYLETISKLDLEDASCSSNSEGSDGQLAVAEVSNVNVDEERGKPYPDYLRPTQVEIPPAGVGIQERATLICVPGEIVSPSEFYLAVSRGFPQDLNNFITRMTQSYQSWFKLLPEEMFMLYQNPEFIHPGCFVACFNTTTNTLLEKGNGKEIVRAKVIREVSQADPKKLKRYLVLLIDLGEYAEVKITDMFFLDNIFTVEPAWAIKCRFSLEEYYDGFHDPDDLKHSWDKKTIRFMADVLKSKERRLEVQFVRRVADPSGVNTLIVDKEGNEIVQVEPEDPEMVWEVHILGIDPPHKHIHAYLERAIIRWTTGNYTRTKKLAKQEKKKRTPI